jgi:molybdenum-dependent DNA-binding transcriptional regulator ModE
MPKSRVRGGKKAHRKRVQNRKNKIISERNRYNKYQQEIFEKLIEEQNKQQNKGENIPNVDQIEGIDGPEL